MNKNWLLLFVSLTLLFSCRQKTTQPDIDFNPLTPHQDQMIDSVAVEVIKGVDWTELDELNQKALVSLQLDNNSDLKIDSTKLFSVNILPLLYKLNDGQFIWTDTQNIKDAYRALELSYLDGLLPEDFHKIALERVKQKLLDAEVEEQKQALFAKHDILLTDAILMYGFQLLIGKVDPASIDDNWNYPNRTISELTAKSFFEIIKERKLLDGIDQLRPKNIEYKAMMNAILFYSNQLDIEWVDIEIEDKIEVGDTNQYLPLVRERLSLCCKWNETPEDSVVYDSTLLAAIVSFQNSHGLEPDGVIGKATAELLNLTPQQRIDKLKVNLERLRWLHDEVGDYTVEVNIAAFKLSVLEAGQLIYQCNVVTGLPYHKTPIFTAPMKYIDFNPTWTVPYSIATNELLPKLKNQGSSYLSRNNMELLNRSGKAIDASSVDFNALSTGNFPYIIRQKSGPSNTLGVVKFMFPNQYSVYLHDTQSKTLFSRSSRAFSHGCIRVENPLTLAEILLDDKKAWDRDKMEKVIATRKTKSVNLKRDVVVKILYYTAGLFPDGTLYYLPDVYKRDQAILEQLEKPFEYNVNTLKRIYPDNSTISKIDSLMN
ncbi:MAG: L,D-transpeptidase family protein [Chitinophagales bacterium]